MLRLVQEDLERARQWRMEKQQQIQPPAAQPAPMPPPAPSQPVINGTNNNNTSAVPDQERMRKIEAFQRKQRELEATQAAEERIIREAQRRKDEEVRQQHWARPSQAPNQRLDNLLQQQSEASSSSSAATSTTTTTTKRVSFFQETVSSEKIIPREDPDVSARLVFQLNSADRLFRADRHLFRRRKPCWPTRHPK